MPNGGDGSMFKTVEAHGELINKDILPRLGEVEKKQEEFSSFKEEMKTEITSMKANLEGIKGNLTGMELTILKDGAQTRDILLNRFVDHYFDADGKAMMTKEKVTLTKIGAKEKIWLAIIGLLAGGGLTTAANIFITYMGK